MNRKIAFLVVITVLCTGFLSCVKEAVEDLQQVENRALRAWIKKNKPELLENYQEEGGYYVDVKQWGDVTTIKEGNDFGGEPIMDQDTCWMFYRFTGYNLSGDVCITRSENVARLQGKYSVYTHYVPYLNYCGVSNDNGLMEGTYISTRNEIKLGEEYVKNNPECHSTTFRMRKGSKVWLYLPSSIGFGTSSTSPSGGYEGQFTLDNSKPMIMEVEILRVIKNPSDKEIGMVDQLVAHSNLTYGRDVWKKVEKPEDEDKDLEDETEDEFFKGLYYNTDYDPSNVSTSTFGYMKPENLDIDVKNAYHDNGAYSNMSELETKIDSILVAKFKDRAIPESERTDDNLIGTGGVAKIWYVGRFLDGFVFDTNIPEIKQLIDKTASSSSSVISYCAESDETSYITAWYHCVPKLYYGSFASIMTTSGFAYGNAGVSGSTSSSSSASYDYSLYDPYYSGYYDYYGYYNTYMNPYGYYDYSNYSGSSSANVDTSTISTEILPYNPLIFYVFIEKKK
ncbi:MAG: hypothetical protein KBS95_00245 [Alistipes sp.]|nr:hypothetical protein [Candidatus Alistipes equi]